MKRIYMMYYKSKVPGENNVSIDPKFCMMTKEQAKELVEEYNDTHEVGYRYYSIPKLWQRTKLDGTEESISIIDRFMRIYYMHHDKFDLVSDYQDDEIPKELKEFFNYSKKRDDFKKHYYTIISFLRDAEAIIKSIPTHHDDEEEIDTVTFIFTLPDQEEKEYSIRLEKVKIASENDGD